MAELKRNVDPNALTPGMKLVQVTRFDSKYKCLDSRTLAFLKSDLQGATIVVVRDSKEYSVSVEELKTLDEIKIVERFPPGHRFAVIEAGTADVLADHGFLAFTVEISAGQTAVPSAPDLPPKARARHIENPQQARRLDEAEQFLELVQEAAPTRDRATLAVEEMLEQGRRGSFSRAAAEAAVGDLLNLGMSQAVQAIAGLKASDQTYAHCVDMAAIFADVYGAVSRGTQKEPSAETTSNVLLAGFMHDIGKCKVPQEILDSTARFDSDSEEMRIMRTHSSEGAKILSQMDLGKEAVNVALCHHVKKDTSLKNSYPNIRYDQVLPISRMAAIVDVYQALIGKRNYKPNWVPGKAVQLLMKLRSSEFDERMLGHFLRSVGIYPIGSLVRLSTDELAFVVRNEPEYLERPVVVVVETARGELISHHNLVDLVAESDLSVTEVVDHYKHYSDSADQAFDIFRSVRLG